MKVAIMQPYFLPYIGYFQLIGAVDLFIVYDNIKYTKKGWINRNRMLVNGVDVMFSLPLKKESDSLQVVQRNLAADFNPEKLLNGWRGAYARAPYFEETFALLERIVRNQEKNLFGFIHSSIVDTCSHLGLGSEIRVSSDIAIDHELKGEDKVIALCEAVGARTYINATGGLDLYSSSRFQSHGIDLRFIQSVQFEYPQFGATFVPWLSIVDTLMFNSLDALRESVAHSFTLI